MRFAIFMVDKSIYNHPHKTFAKEGLEVVIGLC
jgi:hypothetical protein